MDTRALEGKRSLKERAFTKDDCIGEDELLDDDMEEDESGVVGVDYVHDDEKRKGVGVAYGKRGSGGASPPSCQVERCGADLTDAKRYHRRHKVCEIHAKASAVVVAGLRQRFCQQCSRFHELVEFDEAKRSCRRRLAGHNERRRKSSAESCGEGSSRNKGAFSGQLKESQCRQVDERGKYQITIPAAANSTSFKRSHIR